MRDVTEHPCFYSVRFLASRQSPKLEDLSRSVGCPRLLIQYIRSLPVVLYGCETWSLTLREECRLSVFENRILRRIFGPKRNGNGEWRRNWQVHSLYRSPNIVRVIKSRRLRWAGHVARMDESRSAFKMLTGFTYKKQTFRKDLAKIVWQY